MTTEKTVETLQEEHTDMLATAYDIGLEVPDELKANFTDAGAGAGILSALDALIREHQGKEEVVLANDGEEEHTGTEASSVEQAPPKKPRKSKPKAKKKDAAKAASVAASGETEVAIVKAKTAKVATPKKAAKPTPAKKAPGKKASASARTKVAGTPRVKYEDGQKLVKLGDNPSDPKSGRGQRIANVLKHNGKTYKTYRASGGKDGTLNWCIKAGLVKVA